MNYQYLIAIVAYMAAVVVIGALFAKRANKNTEEYFLGGRSLGPWVSRIVLMLFSLFWKRTTQAGAVAGMVTGGITVFVWNFVISKLGGIFAVYELFPAFVLASIAIVVVSLITKKTAEPLEREFNEVNA